MEIPDTIESSSLTIFLQKPFTVLITRVQRSQPHSRSVHVSSGSSPHPLDRNDLTRAWKYRVVIETHPHTSLQVCGTVRRERRGVFARTSRQRGSREHQAVRVLVVATQGRRNQPHSQNISAVAIRVLFAGHFDFDSVARHRSKSQDSTRR